jgi:hypothetical protein
MSHLSEALSRRAVLGAGLVLPLVPRLAMAQPRALAFAVFRNEAKIGEHHIAFAGEADAMTAMTEAEMVVKLGPVPIFKYRHHAIETVRGGAFASLETRTTSNGKLEHVTAEKTAGGVDVDCPAGKLMLAANVSPLNHWNLKSFPGPFFNPETGKQMKLTVSRAGPNRWALRGEVEMDDVYDEAGQWIAARARGTDGSTVEYRRL